MIRGWALRDAYKRGVKAFSDSVCSYMCIGGLRGALSQGLVMLRPGLRMKKLYTVAREYSYF